MFQQQVGVATCVSDGLKTCVNVLVAPVIQAVCTVISHSWLFTYTAAHGRPSKHNTAKLHCFDLP